MFRLKFAITTYSAVAATLFMATFGFDFAVGNDGVTLKANAGNKEEYIRKQVSYWSLQALGEIATLVPIPTTMPANTECKVTVMGIMRLGASAGDLVVVEKAAATLENNQCLKDPHIKIKADMCRIKAKTRAGLCSESVKELDTIIQAGERGEIYPGLNFAEISEACGFEYSHLGDFSKLKKCFEVVANGGRPPQDDKLSTAKRIPSALYLYQLSDDYIAFEKLVRESDFFSPPLEDCSEIAYAGFFEGIIGNSALAQKLCDMLPATKTDDRMFVNAGICFGKDSKGNIETVAQQILDMSKNLAATKYRVEFDQNIPTIPSAYRLALMLGQSQLAVCDAQNANKIFSKILDKLKADSDLTDNQRNGIIEEIVKAQYFAGDTNTALSTVNKISIVTSPQSWVNMLAMCDDLSRAKRSMQDRFASMKVDAIKYQALGLAFRDKNAEALKLIQAELPKESWPSVCFFIAEEFLKIKKWPAAGGNNSIQAESQLTSQPKTGVDEGSKK